MHLRFLFACILVACFCPIAFAADLDGGKIDQLTGGKGVANAAEGVYKVNFPRNDVKITVNGTVMPPFMGLTSWAGFKSGEKVEAMVTGDTRLSLPEI